MKSMIRTICGNSLKSRSPAWLLTCTGLAILLASLMVSGLFLGGCKDSLLAPIMDDIKEAEEQTWSYTVTFDSGEADTPAVPTTKIVAKPATTVQTLPVEPVRTEYSFGGWWTENDGGGVAFSASTAVTGNLTVYAKWTADAIVTMLAIPGIVAPVRGEVPVTTAIDTVQYTGTVTWDPAEDTFAASTVYAANIVLTAKAGWTLNGVAENSFTVAGATTVTNAVNSGTVAAVFPATGLLSDVDVTFSSATQFGGTSNAVNTTSLTLTFSVDPGSLTVDHITVTGATKGALTGTGTTRSLTISEITVANGETVSVTVASPSGYAITGSPREAVVYRAPTTINLLAIPGVTAPVTGATPVSTIIETSQYTGTVAWSDSPTTFAAYSVYTATIVLTAKTGFTFDGVALNSFTVASANPVTYQIDSGVVVAQFPRTAAVVNIAAIPGVTAPVTGTTPVTTITETEQYTGTVAWSGSPTTFAASTVYTATITLTAKADHTLTGVAANFFTVAGATPVSNSANSGVVSAVFPATEAPSDIAVTFSSVTQVGGASNSSTTTSLTLTFSADPVSLTVDNISVTGATKGSLTGTGTTRSLEISDITVANGETVSVHVESPTGYAISGSPQLAVVYVQLAGSYAIGSTGPGGGMVFYDAGSIQSWGRYLEAAPNTWNGGSSDPTAQWKTTETTTAGTLTAIGSGYANTYTYMAGDEHPAAALCRAYTGGGQTDWFLPSKDELNQLYLQKATVGGFVHNGYWSSSEGGYGAWIQGFYDGGQGSEYKYNSYYARPVRAFGGLPRGTIVFVDAAPSKALNSGVYTNAVSGDGDGAITYSSSTPATATIHATTGAVTLLAEGTTLITAVKAATDTYATVTNSYTLTVTAAVYAIGSTGPGGGMVFYDAGSIQSWGRYLEAAPNTWNGGSSDPTAQWKTTETTTAGTLTAIGSGYANTYTYMAGDEHPAAALCRAYTGGGQTDWFLPSKDELNQLYMQKATVGGFVHNGYWSSSEGGYGAWLQGFYDGGQGSEYVYNNYCARPVRAFGGLPRGTIVFADAAPSKALNNGVYTNAVSGDGDGAITYSSSTPATATIHATTGAVTLVAEGTTLITAVKAATATYATVTNTYTLTVTAAVYTIGSTGPGGGIVFYDAGSIQSWGRYLEAAPNTWNGGSSDPTALWKTSNTATAGTLTAIGSGYTNTYTYMTGAEHPAAALCRVYTGGGKTDWFLPSKDELNQLYLQKATVGGFVTHYYWSSSEGASDGAWGLYFSDGLQGNFEKSNNFYVRPVRAFGGLPRGTIVFTDATPSKALNSGVYTNAVSGEGDGTITYTSSTPATATIDATTGAVTLVAEGTTLITAVKAATATHATVTNTYTLTVTVAVYTIGSTGPGGGIVFYTTDGGLHGLEVAPNTWDGGAADPTAQWKTSNTTTAGTSTAIGNGYANTYTYMTGTEHPAAALCRACTFGGKNDWFLPSQDELDQLYLQKTTVGGFVAGLYWSSSEYNSDLAWSQGFYDGGQHTDLKDNIFYVRPVRAF